MNRFSNDALNRLLSRYLDLEQWESLESTDERVDDVLRRLSNEPGLVSHARSTLRSSTSLVPIDDRQVLTLFVEQHLQKSGDARSALAPGLLPAPERARNVAREPEPIPEETSYVLLNLVDDLTEEPVAGVELVLKLPDGKRQKVKSDAQGQVELKRVSKGLFSVGAEVGDAKLNQVLDLVWWGITPSRRPLEAIQPEAVLDEGTRNRLLKVQRHKVSTGETLESVAEQYDLSWKELALFNWGRADPDGINAALKDAVGCTRKTADGKNYVFDDSDEPGILYIPKPWERGGLDTGLRHVIRVRAVRPRVERLESRFALERLTDLARRMEKPDFLSWLLVLFGVDIPADAYEAFRRELLDGKVEPPPIRVVELGLHGHEAGYDSVARTIKVRQKFARAAEEKPEEASKLLLALLEEFGHHVDQLLRNTYSKVSGDAPLDEGARFAHSVYTQWLTEEAPVEFATSVHDGSEHPLRADFSDVQRTADLWLNEAQQEVDDSAGSTEFFGAGRGHGDPKTSFGHQSIGDALSEFFDDDERLSIYFGNWLRDISQVVDPKLVREPGSKTLLQSPFSRKALTDCIDVMAREEFGNNADFRVTPQKLGLYRPEEHIDNPHGIEDGTKKDPAFHPGWTPAEVALNMKTGLLNYIATPGTWKSAAGFMEQELRAAVANGRTPEGMRRLGAALHTLEDFFSHSNFLELSLIRLGHVRVCPWVWQKVPAPTPRFPLVTGKFGGDDTQVSLLYVLAEKMQAVKECKAGERSSGAKIALILMKDVPDVIPGGFTNRFEGMLENLEELQMKYPTAATLACRVGEALSLWLGVLQADFARSRAKAVTRAQDEHLADPKSMNPTHSQLSKDHDDHPLHVPAAHIAAGAVMDVGGVMSRAWFGQASADDVVRTGLKYLVHPEDIQQSSATDGRAWVLEQLRTWARENPAALPRLTKEAITESQDNHAKKQHALLQKSFEQRSGTNEALAVRFAELRAEVERA
ncbi:LysM peptidoglycan-binding domain-containing protein [Archangium violaceum]|uniref:HET-C-related protein n=1 Tax=Archangium violaceum TaxID=83451 RepID=UPI00193C30C0|nr:HET-C-related protein [Archangium violaceum]QRK04884.1 LysM peptidoglycan-binding domain-containing protein [Archangium violaceum]